MGISQLRSLARYFLSFQTLVLDIHRFFGLSIFGTLLFDHLFGNDGDNALDFTILNCDCCRRLFGSEDNPFKKAFLMKFLRGVMDVYRRDDDEEDGIRVTSITRMVFSSGLLQLTDHHLVYLAKSFSQRIVMCVSSYLALICGCTAMLLGLTP
ncbi:hypothetical protein CsSME_00030811 [Camellia sinensis var. sinensis]